MCALVPCHHEAPSEILVRELRRAVGEVIVLDDGVPPPSNAALDELARTGVQVVRLGQNLGKGHALARGFSLLLRRPDPPDAVMVVDADGQHPVGAVPAFVGSAAGADLVLGNRFGDLASMPRHRRVSNRLATWALSRAVGMPLLDSQCGMRLIRISALLEVPFPAGGYEAETAHLKRCVRAGLRVSWVPIPAIYAGERSGFRKVRDSLRVARAIAQG